VFSTVRETANTTRKPRDRPFGLAIGGDGSLLGDEQNGIIRIHAGQ
jgi:hypothetical protein